MRSALRRYFLTAAGTVLFGGVALAVGNGGFMKQVGEINRYAAVVARQSTDDETLFGAATMSDMFLYKLKLTEERRPDLLALGSSRALQFRRESFTVPFANAGLAMTHFGEGEAFIAELSKRHTPTVALITLDLWWFLEGTSDPDYWLGVHQEGGVGGLHRDTLTLPLQWSLAGKITPVDYVSVLAGRTGNRYVSGPTLGVQAAIDADGFRPDGSYQYGSASFESKGTWYDARFRNVLGRVIHGRGPFTPAKRPHPEAFAAFRRFDQLLVENGIHPVYLLPPFAHTVFARLDDRFSYIDAVRSFLADEPVELYDFTDLANLADDCEAVDGLHAGDVAYQRMLLAMVDQNREGPLAQRVDRASLIRHIDAFAGKSVTRFKPERYGQPERDFLQIGCDK